MGEALICPACGSLDTEWESHDRKQWYCYKCGKFFHSEDAGFARMEDEDYDG